MFLLIHLIHLFRQIYLFHLSYLSYLIHIIHMIHLYHLIQMIHQFHLIQQTMICLLHLICHFLHLSRGRILGIFGPFSMTNE